MKQAELLPVGDYKAFVELVEEMRGAQRAYFSTRERGRIATAKRLESDVDRWIDQFHAEQLQSGK